MKWLASSWAIGRYPTPGFEDFLLVDYFFDYFGNFYSLIPNSAISFVCEVMDSRKTLTLSQRLSINA
jgi:hypothetical protein